MSLGWRLYELGADGSRLCSAMPGISSNDVNPSRSRQNVSSDISQSSSRAALNEMSCWRSSSVLLWIHSLEKLARSSLRGRNASPQVRGAAYPVTK